MMASFVDRFFADTIMDSQDRSYSYERFKTTVIFWINERKSAEFRHG
jgi:hypothetical protein